MKKNHQFIFTSLTVTFLFLSSLSVDASSKRFKVSFTPAGKGHPQYTAGGAVRGTQCDIDKINRKPLTAIVPAREESLTSKTHPTFLAYIPPVGASQGIFSIKDQPENFYYEEKITVPSEGGIIAISLPQKITGLEEGQYNWYIKIQCGESPSLNDPFIGASITKVNQENFAPLWYEIAEESLNSPNWNELMHQIDLNFLEDENVTYIR